MQLWFARQSEVSIREITFTRNRIREVRLEHGDDSNTAVGAAVGAGVGAAVGASLGNPSLTKGGSAFLFWRHRRYGRRFRWQGLSNSAWQSYL